jgi:hypothetical protein
MTLRSPDLGDQQAGVPARSYRIARAATLVLLACVAPASVRAELIPYDNDDQRFGAALVVPFGRRELVKKTMEYCGGEFPEMKGDAQVAYAHWIRRHAGYLQLSTYMTRGITEAAAKDASGRGAEMRKLLEYAPQQIEKQSAAQVQVLANTPSEQARRGMCSDSIKRIDARKLDLKYTDPDMTQYLRTIATKYRVALPDDGDLAAASPGARTDAGALLGRWRAEKVRQHLADGSVREGTGGCTIEFAQERLVSECVGGGRQLRVLYSYRVTGDGRYESQILENNLYPTLVGARAISTFKVDKGKLIISAYPSTVASEATRPVEIESISAAEAPPGRSVK